MRRRVLATELCYFIRVATANNTLNTTLKVAANNTLISSDRRNVMV